MRSLDKKIVFLLGAGASVDAGMLTVADLTKQLRELLPNLQDVNGKQRHDFGEVFDFIASQDQEVATNYEMFFEWIKVLLEVQRDPFRKIVDVRISSELTDAIGHLPLVLGSGIARLLEECRAEPGYFARLEEFCPASGRLQVFSLNYDCCVEDACHVAGIDLSTGFDPSSKEWNPSLLETTTRGINLYKLHGSLRWFSVQDTRMRSVGPQKPPIIMELNSAEAARLPHYLKVGWKSPQLILGPGSKIQPDDPFLSLFYQFNASVRNAEFCIVIGYGYRDDHVNAILDAALDAGVKVVDVNPSSPNGRYIAESGYNHLRLSAKDALVTGQILNEVKTTAGR